MSPWYALVVVDAVAVASLARCFTGPGELTAALVTLLAVHLAGLLARGWPRGQAAAAGPAGGLARVSWRTLWWVAGLVAAFGLPIATVFGSTLTFGIPGHATWHEIARDYPAAWRVYALKVAPVPELSDLVLATAWAAGGVAIASELLALRRRVPAALALAPAFGVFVFSAELGTPAWRWPEVAALAAAGVWYLVAAARRRDAGVRVVVATTDSPHSKKDAARAGATAGVVARLALVAAAAAVVLGPNLPGATSAALVALHGSGRTTTDQPSRTGSGLGGSGGVAVSSLVEVAQQEIDNPTGLLFTVHSALATREVVATLDSFDGNAWSSSANFGGPQAVAVPGFATSIAKDTAHPPAPVSSRSYLGTTETIVQALDVAGLTGFEVPAPGTPLAVEGLGQVSRDGQGGALVAPAQLSTGSAYAVEAQLPDPSPAQLDAVSMDVIDPQDSLVDFQLPSPIPPALVTLAHHIVARAGAPYEKAIALQEYFTSGAFQYQLPSVSTAGKVDVGATTYGALLSFLFQTKTGYCQQFATAFAVLARIDGLPTRIAVGFLPGSATGPDTYAVQGSDTHAWPQVLFGSFGWINFEPTPGSGGAPTSQSTLVPQSPATTGPLVHRQSAAHNLRQLAGGGAVAPVVVRSHTRPPSRPGSGTSVVVVLVVVAALLAAGVPARRRIRLARAPRRGAVGMVTVWREALRTLDLAGIRRRRAETYLELAQRVSTVGLLSPEGERALGDLARRATAAVYGLAPVGEDGTRRALKDVRVVQRGARRGVARWQRALAVLDPREVAG